MKLAKTYEEAHGLINEVVGAARGIQAQAIANIGLDVGKQFGTRIIMRIDAVMAHKLLMELEKRDLPLPQVFYYSNRILIGAEPE